MSRDEAELRDRLRLARTERVGPVTYRALLARAGGSAARALALIPAMAAKVGRVPAIPTEAEAARELAALRRLGGRLVAWGLPDFPPMLTPLEDAPCVLSVLGDPARLARPGVAIVGARNASANGRLIAQTMAEALARAGVTIVSGFARGIDTAAHEGALAAGPQAGTVAVMAGGVDVIYPEENAPLHRRMQAGGGTLVAELPPGASPRAKDFPRRNRIISGLARAVIVIEAAERSGSLITASMAADHGREVMAVPGSPLDPRSRGANRLIREGATLVQDAADVLEGLGHLGRRPPPSLDLFQEPEAEPDDRDRARLLEALGPAPTELDALGRATGLPPALLSAALLELELAGRIERQPGNRVALLPAG